MAVGYGFYLTRSALLDFYIAPMVPLFALNLGMFFGWLTRRTKPAGAAVLVACLLVPVWSCRAASWSSTTPRVSWSSATRTGCR